VGLALITGASSGFGAEFARLFAADGHDVVLVARRRDRLDALARELESGGRTRAHVIELDLGKPDAVPTLMTTLEAQALDGLEFLVNNAGFGTSGPFAQSDPAAEAQLIRVNVAALVALTRAVLPGMLARRRGRILNLGSTAGFQAGPHMATYYASKAFVNIFTEALAFELRGTGVTATVSCPGASATEFAAVAGTSKTWLFKLGAASPQTVCRRAYRAMLRGRTMIIHGPKNWFLIQSQRIAPRALVRAITARLNR
jgi:short-subunit dehydrogenase